MEKWSNKKTRADNLGIRQELFERTTDFGG